LSLPPPSACPRGPSAELSPRPRSRIQPLAPWTGLGGRHKSSPTFCVSVQVICRRSRPRSVATHSSPRSNGERPDFGELSRAGEGRFRPFRPPSVRHRISPLPIPMGRGRVRGCFVLVLRLPWPLGAQNVLCPLITYIKVYNQIQDVLSVTLSRGAFRPAPPPSVLLPAPSSKPVCRTGRGERGDTPSRRSARKKMPRNGRHAWFRSSCCGLLRPAVVVTP